MFGKQILGKLISKSRYIYIIPFRCRQYQILITNAIHVTAMIPTAIGNVIF